MSIVVAGSANVDFILRVTALPQPNQTITGHDMAVAIGGKGLNQAVACARHDRGGRRGQLCQPGDILSDE